MRPTLVALTGVFALAASGAAHAAPASEAALFDAAFARPTGGLVAPRSEGVASLGGDGGLRMTAYSSRTPEAVLRPRGAAQTDVALAVTAERNWPLMLTTRRYQFEIVPHAGVGVSDGGEHAEAGASFEVGKRLRNQIGEALNVENGETVYGDRGRWYMFGAFKGRAVGLNLLNAGYGVRGDGLTSERGGFMGFAQAGMGWRKGRLQASAGYTYTRLKLRVWGRQRDHDEHLGVSFSYRP